MAWFVCSWLAWLSSVLLFLAVLIAAISVLTQWLLRFAPERLAGPCRYAIPRRYCQLIAQITGERWPVPNGQGNGTPPILLQSVQQFTTAAEQAKQLVRGHDCVIDSMLSRIREHLALGKRRGGKQRGPLASFFLIGSPGIGKRYLTRVVAKVLYASGNVDVFSCSQLTVGQLVGTKDSPGELVGLLRTDPQRVLLFERPEDASPELCDFLLQLLASGQLRPPGLSRELSLAGTTLVFSTELGDQELAEMSLPTTAPVAWQEAGIETLHATGTLDIRLVHGVTETYFCQSPDDLVKCEVMAMLLSKECATHETQLAYVEPTILAAQVLQWDEQLGFASAPQRIQRLLRGPLVQAAAGSHRTLSLRVRNVTEPTT